MKNQQEIQHVIEDVLGSMIDDWYKNVSRYYVTREQLDKQPQLQANEELKRFHDENGHRIKFDKDNLNFTYGLRSFWEGDSLFIEVSVNNKVDDFDYEDFQSRLASHYRKAGKLNVPTPYELKNHHYEELFQLDTNFQEAFTVERREGRADIMRLSFRLNGVHLDRLADHPISSRELVENYCVTPFRSVYATVYRRNRK